jgi:hypothetical protein
MSLSLETRFKMGNGRRGKSPWNKGLTKNSDERVAAYGINISKAKKETPHVSPMLGKQHSVEAIRKNKEAHTKHGLAGTPFYNTWSGMLARCYRTTCLNYKYYGARGIIVEWVSFEEFKADMYASYIAHRQAHQTNRGTTIERVDNNGNYSRLNCKWITIQEQQFNKRYPKVLL